MCFAAGYPGSILDDAASLTPAAHIMMLILFVTVLRLLTHLRYSTWVAKELKGRKSWHQKQEVLNQQRDRVKELGDACFCPAPCSDRQVVLAPCSSPVLTVLQAVLNRTDSILSVRKQVCCSLMHYCRLNALKSSDK